MFDHVRLAQIVVHDDALVIAAASGIHNALLDLFWSVRHFFEAIRPFCNPPRVANALMRHNAGTDETGS